ncbi:MAG TPA: hypothetical protein VKX34_06830 [Aequorivita sp.]|nr:hypothetical protein [Aequorivita sp.]
MEESKYSKAFKNLFGQRQAQDTKSLTEKEIVYRSITKTPKTMLMIFIDTGITRGNISWRLDDLKDEGRVKLLHKTFCKASGHRAGYYVSTSKDSEI